MSAGSHTVAACSSPTTKSSTVHPTSRRPPAASMRCCARSTRNWAGDPTVEVEDDELLAARSNSATSTNDVILDELIRGTATASSESGRPAYTVAGSDRSRRTTTAAFDRRRSPGLSGRDVRRPVRRVRRLPSSHSRRHAVPGAATPSWPGASRSRRCCRSPATPTRSPRRAFPSHHRRTGAGRRRHRRLPGRRPDAGLSAATRPSAATCSTTIWLGRAGSPGATRRWRRACAVPSAAMPQVVEDDDLLLVAGMRMTQRATVDRSRASPPSTALAQPRRPGARVGGPAPSRRLTHAGTAADRTSASPG